MYNKFLSSIYSSQLNFVTQACDLCGNQKGNPICSVSFIGRDFCFVRCPTCGLVYQNPMLSKESRKHIYETLEYWAHKHQESDDSTMLNYYSYLEEKDVRRQTANIRMNWIAPYLPRDARILDLGCSDGLFVHALSKSGYRTSGIDISNVMISYGREAYGVNISTVDFEENWPFTEPFDAITCYATLSNIINPSRVFTNIRKHLRPGGYFFFNFGCRDRFVSRILGNRLYLYRPTVANIYSKKTVAAYCKKNGFRIKQIYNDVQFVPLARLIGFLRVPGSLWMIKRLGLEKTNLRMVLLTGYAVCAVHRN